MVCLYIKLIHICSCSRHRSAELLLPSPSPSLKLLASGLDRRRKRSEIHECRSEHRLFCKGILFFDTTPCRRMPLLVHF